MKSPSGETSAYLRLQMLGRAHSAEHQHLGGADSPTRQENLLQSRVHRGISVNTNETGGARECYRASMKL